MNATARLAKSQAELAALLRRAAPPPSLIPDLVEIARDPGAARGLAGAELVRKITASPREDIRNWPQMTYTLYREFRKTGERRGYEAPYREKRHKLVAAAFEVLLGDDSYLDALQDYIWDICEETNWVTPAHENREIDLNAVGTGFSLAEIIVGMGQKLAPEVVERVRAEIERRIFEPYLERHQGLNWFLGHNNWNGVCNSGVGAMFLLLEEDVDRLARALSYVLEGLAFFLQVAFEAEGSSTEGASYWQYGLSNLIPFSEMLRSRTGGAIDILAMDRLRDIAAYPARMMLSVGRYANFSDCEEVVAFNPANIARLAERTGVVALYDLLAEGASMVRDTNFGRFHNLWRIIAWWDGSRPRQVEIADMWAKDVGVVRLTGQAPDGAPLVLAAKAGHNAENHNQNDVGSLIVHVDGESLLCEPGRGLYSRSYFGPRRYENAFANSYGHSVPRIGGQLQSAGAEYRGQVVACEATAQGKRVQIEIAGAYQAPGLRQARRTLHLTAAGDVVLEDAFLSEGAGLPIEEAFVTWFDASVSGSTARITGQRHTLEMTVEEPAGASFSLEVMREASEANAKPVPLKRLTIDVGPAPRTLVRIRARVLTR